MRSLPAGQPRSEDFYDFLEGLVRRVPLVTEYVDDEDPSSDAG